MCGVKAVTELALNAENQKRIVKEGFVPHVLKLCNCGSKSNPGARRTSRTSARARTLTHTTIYTIKEVMSRHSMQNVGLLLFFLRGVTSSPRLSERRRPIHQPFLTMFARAYETVTDLEKASTLCMARLAQSNVNRPKIIYHGGFKPLVYNAQVCLRSQHLHRVSVCFSSLQ